jgi:hypothetical protein
MMILVENYEIFKLLNKEEFKLVAIPFLAVLRLEIGAMSSDNLFLSHIQRRKKQKKKFKVKVVDLWNKEII